MPTSIAHAVAGGAVARAIGERPVRGWALLLLVVVLANLPDVDYLLGAFVDAPRDWHRGPTHTLGAAVLAGLVVAAVLSVRGQPFWRTAAFGFAIYASHLVLDMIMPDNRGSPGIPLLWPVTNAHFTALLPIPGSLRSFIDLPLGETTTGFFESLATWHTVAVFLVEGALFTPVLLLAYVFRPPRRVSTVQGKMPRSR